MPSFRLTISYDGTDFFGSQVQPGRRTVQGELERELSTLAGEPVRGVFAGRTDRGVHAVGQTVAVVLPSWRGSPGDLQRALNARLPADLAATAVSVCVEGFNPRFDAAWREYRYWLAFGVVDPFLGRFAWMLRSRVDSAALDAAAKRFVGVHDFASFAGGGEGVPWSARAKRRRGTVRSVFRCESRNVAVTAGPSARPADSDSVLEIRVAADAFLPHMVRTMVGALVEVGQGRRAPGWIDALLGAKDRRAGPLVAPPCGLTLWRVGFGDDELDVW